MQAIQGLQQQQIQVGDRPIMPVVSMSTQPGTQQVQQTLQQTIPGTITQAGIPLQPNLAVTQQPMSVGMQQLHSVSIFYFYIPYIFSLNGEKYSISVK